MCSVNLSISSVCVLLTTKRLKPDADDSLFFSILGRSLCEELEIETLDDLQQLLDGFLFSDNLVGYRLETFAEVGLKLRTQESTRQYLPELNGLVDMLTPGV